MTWTRSRKDATSLPAGAFALGGDLPGHRHLDEVPVRVLHGGAGLADPAHPRQHCHARRGPIGQCYMKLRKQILAACEGGGRDGGDSGNRGASGLAAA